MARLPLTINKISPTKVVISAISARITPEQFFRLCSDNRDLQLELTARKEIVIMPPSGGETGARNLSIVTQLAGWAKRDGTGIAFDADTGFTLPNGAVRGPDAAWIPRQKWHRLSKDQREKFAPICPDFVIELRSPRDTVAELKEKMAEYIENGAQLGWLINRKRREVFVYRPSRPVERLQNPLSVSADPALSGFVLDLTEVWDES